MTDTNANTYQWPLYYQLSEEARAMLLPHPSFHPNEFFYAQQQQQLTVAATASHEEQAFGQSNEEQRFDGEEEEHYEDNYAGDDGYELEGQGDEDETEEPEFELSEEMIERFVKTEMRRRQRKEDEKRIAEEREEEEKRRLAALILTPEQKKAMYGEKRYEELRALEDQLQGVFDRRRNELRPAYWPELPLS